MVVIEVWMDSLQPACLKRRLGSLGRLLVLAIIPWTSQSASAEGVVAASVPLERPAMLEHPIGGQRIAQNLILRPMPRPIGGLRRREDIRLLGTWFGSMGWGASAGNSGGMGRVYSHLSYRWRAARSGTIDQIRFDINWHRAAYFGGTGGDMRITIRKNAANDWPDLTAGGILWQSPLFVGMADPPPAVERVHAGKIAVAVAPLQVTAGTIYHFVWTNENNNSDDNWYSINHLHNWSLPLPYHPYPPWVDFATLVSTVDQASFTERNRWMPHILIHYQDGVWLGQPITDAGQTANVMTPEGGGSKAGNTREIVGEWQIRQRWKHDSDTIVVDRWRGRVWRRTADIDGGLRVRLEREADGGGAVILADITIPARAIFETEHDNQEGQVFPPVDVPLGTAVKLERGSTYRLRLSATGSTRYAMRAPNGGSKATLNIGWNAWLGRGEYSTDGGSSWTGMHHYDQDDRSTNDWNMALHNISQ